MTSKRITSSAVALAVAAGLSPILASVAQAAPVPTKAAASFSTTQMTLEHDIIARQVQLATLGTQVANGTNITASDRSALSTIISGEQSALATDAANAASATTMSQLDSVRQAMYVDERVYAVVTAQVDLVGAADNDTVTEAGYTALVSDMTPFVNELGSAHATKLLSDVSSEVASASALTTGVSSGALALTPAGYPGNQSQVKTYKYQLAQVSKDLKEARSDINAIERVALGVHRLPIIKHV